jgi:hypothetical protein
LVGVTSSAATTVPGGGGEVAAGAAAGLGLSTDGLVAGAGFGGGFGAGGTGRAIQGPGGRGWDTATLSDAGHIAQTLESDILKGQALLDPDFLADITHNPGLRNALHFSAGEPSFESGAASTSGSDAAAAAALDHGKRLSTSPTTAASSRAHPPTATTTAASGSPPPPPPSDASLPLSSSSPSATTSSSSHTSTATIRDPIPLSPQMKKQLRDLNVKIAALGLGIAKANQGSESTIRDIVAHVSDCEIKEVETLRTSEHQDALMILAAKSFFNRTASAKVHDALAPLSLIAGAVTSMSSDSVAAAAASTYATGANATASAAAAPAALHSPISYMANAISYGASFGDGVASIADDADDESFAGDQDPQRRWGQSGMFASTTADPGASLMRRVFSMHFLDMCRRNPTMASEILAQFSNEMAHNLALPQVRYLRPIGTAFTDNSPWRQTRGAETGLGSSLGGGSGGGRFGAFGAAASSSSSSSSSAAAAAAAAPARGSRRRRAAVPSISHMIPGMPMDSDSVFTTLSDFMDDWKDGDHVELGRSALASMVTCAIHEESVLQLLQVAKTLLSPTGKAIVDGAAPASKIDDDKSAFSSPPNALRTSGGRRDRVRSRNSTSFMRALNPSLDALRNAATEPRLSLPVSSQWMASISLPKSHPLQTPAGVDFSLRIEGGSITIGKDFFLRFSIPKGYAPGPDDFIGLYDSSGTLVDWYKATDERRSKGLHWASGKLQAYADGGAFEIQYVHRVENNDGSGNARSFKMGSPLIVNAIKRFSSCTNDGARVFVYNERGLHAFGTGFGGTVAGACVSKSQDNWQKRRGWVAYASGFLYLLLIDPRCPLPLAKGAHLHGAETKTGGGTSTGFLSAEGVELVKLDPLTLCVISRKTIGAETKSRGGLEESERAAFLSAAASFADSSTLSSSSTAKAASQLPRTSPTPPSHFASLPFASLNRLNVEEQPDLHRLIKQAGQNTVLFSDGNLLYTMTPAQELADDVLLSPPRSFSRAMRSPSPFSLGPRNPLDSRNFNSSLDFSPGSPPSRTIDTKLSHTENERKATSKEDVESPVAVLGEPSVAAAAAAAATAAGSGTNLVVDDDATTESSPVLAAMGEPGNLAVAGAPAVVAAGVPILPAVVPSDVAEITPAVLATPSQQESKRESLLPRETKSDENAESKPTSSKSSSRSKDRKVNPVHAWRRGIKVTAFAPDTLAAVAHYSLRVPPRVGFEVKPRSKYYRTPPVLLAPLGAAGGSRRSFVLPAPCVVFCGPGAQRCRQGILRSWSLHSEIPGRIELCVWRRFAVNVVVRVASFKIDDVVKGIQTIHVPSTPVQVSCICLLFSFISFSRH